MTVNEKDRRTVRVDMSTLAVYPEAGNRTHPIGAVTVYVQNQGARTPTGGKFTSHRITVNLYDTECTWVGQFSNEEWNRKATRKKVILRPLIKDDAEEFTH